MFSQKKRKYTTWIYLSIAVLIAVFAVYLLLSFLGDAKREPVEETNSNSQTYEQTDPDDADTQQETEKEVDGDDEATKDPLEETDSDDLQEEKVYQSYYLVKYDNHVIRIYFSDQSGKLTELEETTIVYETLSVEDQKRFQEGIRLDSRDDLNKLMMDYES